ncbi:MAG: LCP family protein [Coriobacteriales bacterium]|nr:LCP family protein [Coriobacteriales bacterium]
MPKKPSPGRRVDTIRDKEIDLVSARAELNKELSTYSRHNRSQTYATQRSRRNVRKRVAAGIGIGLAAVLVGLVVFIVAWMVYLQDALHRDSQGNLLDLELIDAVTIDRERPEDPFYVLLVGTDDTAEGGISRSDTIILARIDPQHKKAALVSIPRDTRVQIPGYGYQKINAAYAYGMLEEENGHSGPEFLIDAVSKLTGIGIHDYVQVDFSGFRQVVDALGGVEVDVPVDIIGDRDAGNVDVYAGQQRLDGEHALVFVRSRAFEDGDYQRQANQRTFIQATARQMLASDPVTLVNSINALSQIIATSFDPVEIATVAGEMRGIQESDIYTYSIPCASEMIDGAWYEIPDMAKISSLMNSIDRGETPDPEQLGLTRQGEVPDSYRPPSSAAGTGADPPPFLDTSLYMVDVRNGYGIPGAASAVSDMLALAGYQQGTVGDANTYAYTETLVICQSEGDRAAAQDIVARLGYGRVIASEGRYSFAGNVLVIVGGDFKT